MAANEDWQLCASWLIRCKILPNDHRVLWPTAEVFELAQTLRDGVLICHLLNTLKTGSVDLKDFSQRPQMSQFLCLKNIRSFIMTCRSKFDLNESDLFDPYDLFEVKDFGKVIHTLSCLSQSVAAKKTGILGFLSSTNNPEYFHNRNRDSGSDYYNKLSDLAEPFEFGSRNRRDSYVETEDVYGNLPDRAIENDMDDDIYGTIDNDDNGEEIYGLIVNDAGAGASASASAGAGGPSRPPRTPSTPRSPGAMDRLTTRRDYCVKEMVETEQNYVKALGMICENFIRPLRSFELIMPDDKSIIFKHLETLYGVHTEFCKELYDACQNTDSSQSTYSISQCFLKYKSQFLVYGDFCSNLPQAQELVDSLCMRDPRVADRIMECQRQANNNKFKLRDLLAVPMQRILKYGLLMKELIKETERTDVNRDRLTQSLEEMQDLSLYVNEVKRDNEHIQIIKEIQQSIQDLRMPEETTLKDYGRLLRDGELKVKLHDDGKLRLRYIFLFDRVLMMCKPRPVERFFRGEQYSYKNALALNQFSLDTGSNTSTKSRPWTPQFTLFERKEQTTVYSFYARTDESKSKWIDAINMANENTQPEGHDHNNCRFIMFSFPKPTTCDHCGKLLRGVFFQGYQCQNTDKNVHKECILKINAKAIHGRVKAIQSYNGNPPPGLGRALPFEAGDVIELTNTSNQNWYKGRLYSKEGYFPSSYVKQHNRPGSKIPGKPDYEQQEVPNGPVVQPPTTHPRSIQGDLALYPWFSHAMSRQQANQLMEQYDNGTFLIRESAERKGHALSIKFNNAVKHIKVMKDDMYYLANCKMFHTIPDLVEFYQKNSLEGSFPELKTVLVTPYKHAIAPPSDICGYCTAMFDYSANQPNQLSLRTGTEIAIISKAGGFRGWWKGRLGNKVGYFPSAYVVEEGE